MYGDLVTKVDKIEFMSALPIRPSVIGDVGDIAKDMLRFNATVFDVFPSLPRRRVADWYDHVETRLMR